MLNLNGIAYTVSRRGKPTAPPLILIHGAGGMSLSWPPQIRRLADTTVFAPDLPNHGKSLRLDFQTLEEVASILLDWLNNRQIHQMDLCGHSMGGAISLILALQAPSRIRKLIIIGSAARLAVNPILLELSAQPATLPQAIELLIKWSFSRDTPQRLKELTAHRLRQNHPNTLYQDFYACNQFDLSSQLGKIQQPTLILTGEDDRMTPPESAQQLAQNLPNAQLQLIPNGGHMVVLEQPDEIAQRLWAFCHQPQ